MKKTGYQTEMSIKAGSLWQYMCNSLFCNKQRKERQIEDRQTNRHIVLYQNQIYPTPYTTTQTHTHTHTHTHSAVV